MRETLYVFARAPVPGRSKTRLIPAVGPERAAALHAAFLDDVCAVAAAWRAAAATERRAILSVAGDVEHPGLRSVSLRHGLPIERQPDGDLGARMAATLVAATAREEAGAGSCERAAIVGSDAPLITADMIERAFAQLEGSDLVVGPAEDGGYWLVGARATATRDRARFAAIFDETDWGTGSVRSTTERRANERGFTVAHGETHWDVDEPVDLARLERAIDEAAPAGCAPSTRRLLPLPARAW